MSGIYIRGMEMPTKCVDCILDHKFFKWLECNKHVTGDMIKDGRRSPACPLIPVPDHGRLIDADALRAKMYHEAFETDTPMQKWDSGCWIRYKMFERMEEAAPTIIPASKEGE